MKKRKILLCFTAIFAIILAILFIPRKLNNLVSFKNVDTITYCKNFEEITLNDNQIINLKQYVQNTKYRKRYRMVKTASVWKFKITYLNGNIIEFSNARYDIYDSDGRKKGNQYILYGDLNKQNINI